MFVRSKALRAIRKSLEAGNRLGAALRASGLHSRSTLFYWRKRPLIDRYMRACLDRCRERRVEAMEDALFKKGIEGSVLAQIYFLNNRAPGEWKEKREIEHSGEVAGAERKIILIHTKEFAEKRGITVTEL